LAGFWGRLAGKLNGAPLDGHVESGRVAQGRWDWSRKAEALFPRNRPDQLPRRRRRLKTCRVALHYWLRGATRSQANFKEPDGNESAPEEAGPENRILERVDGIAWMRSICWSDFFLRARSRDTAGWARWAGRVLAPAHATASPRRKTQNSVT
jgi:hypothetical protein